MAQSLLAVKEVDRERFMDLCLKRRIHCDTSRFREPDPDFSWREGITKPIKTRFWYAYACVYNANLTQCPVDGEWSPWSPWSDCSASCDATGNQTRTRTCTNPMPVQGGELCHGSTKRARPCLGMCKNGTDRGGVEGAKDFLEQVHMAYPSLQHDCFNAHCTYGVVQRTITEKFVMCSLKCGAGSRTRTRLCNSPQPAFAGHPCKGEFHEQQSCVMRDCGSTSSETFTEWTKWTPCSVSCGVYGAQQSTRVCLRHVGCDLVGVMTPYLNRSRPCYTGDCPTLGGWSEWSDWTDCSAACGVGRQSRIRMCDSPYPSGGLFCLGEVVDFQLCKGLSCVGQPVHPENTAYRRRPGEVREDVLVSRGDKYLDGPLNPTMEGLYSPWSQWVRCSATCGKGTRIRKRWCSAQTTPMPPCEGEVRQIQFCNVFVCPVVGGWGVWLPWTPCSKTCGHGERQRYRTCNNPLPQFGGSCLGDSMRVEKCDAGTCPRIARGTWSDWSPWSQCTATCDGGQRQRKRVRQGYMNSSRTAESVSDEGDGVQETLICNTQPCPVDGSWAEWGDWSRCSVHCGLGRRVRDRTCTDPSPVFGGTVCPGPGSDLVHCFAGPCKDTEDRAVYLGTTTWIRFAPHNRPTRFLVIYLHFKPMAPDGSLLHRYRQCRSVFDDDDNDKEGGSKGVTLDDAEDRKNSAEDKKADDDEKCQLLVHVSLDQAAVVLLVMARGARLEIQSPVTLSLGAWHEILVEVLRSGASLRVNNHERLFANFSRPLIKDLDFDSYMILGASDNKTVGMTGSISSLSINFRTQDLFSSTDWEGQGTPIGRHAVSVQSIKHQALSINESLTCPVVSCRVRAKTHPVRLYHTDRLAVRMTLALDGGEGLLLYCPGQGLGTLVTLGLRQRRFVLCMRCSRGAVTACHHGDPWYHVSVLVEDTESEMRVDQGKALQLTCKGLPFRPRKMIFVGGRSAIMWEEVRRSANYTKGFFGVLGTLVVNGRTLAFRHAVLLSRDGRINMDGYSRATRITPVFEHKSSVVVLHCEVEQPIDPAIDVRVVWLLRDTIIEPSALVDIVKPVGLTKRVGSLQLKPGAHSEGIYACLISRDGALELSHVFPVFRHAARPELYEGQVEWVFLKVLLILLPILTIACIAYRLRNW
ncbi:uncharacterized protein LOC143291836 [Babylonia areolata]|uniref:uncharacterized protein LOC143291836 n=1 Tax=Babylonia areolata TaxID=304850 RepID=UPI003FD098B4